MYKTLMRMNFLKLLRIAEAHQVPTLEVELIPSRHIAKWVLVRNILAKAKFEGRLKTYDKRWRIASWSI